MKNKKAFLVDETLRIILSVIVIVLLFIGAWGVYSTLNKDTDLENAQAIIDSLNGKIQALNVPGFTTATVQGFPSDENWFITGWGIEEPDAPDKCAFQSCICICSGNAEINSCQTRGICRSVSADEIIIESQLPETRDITEEDRLDPNVNFPVNVETGNKIKVNYIKLPENFLLIEIEKGENPQNQKTFLTLKND